jgi:ATP phosphoribosyltransferase
MLQEQIKKLENIIDEEITGYKNIEKLYADKKEILIKGKGNDLINIDAKIMNTFKSINSLSEARKDMSLSMNIPTHSMTDIINYIRKQETEAASKCEKKIEIVNTLAH